MIKRSNLIVSFAMLTLTLIGSASAQVTNTYVAVSGSDANPCTISQPCATVTRGVSAVDAGGKVLIIENGDYQQFSIFKSVTVAAANGIHASINATVGFAIFNNGLQPTDSITISNLNLVALNPDSSGISNFLGGSMFIENCSFYGFKDGVISLRAGRTYVTNSTFRKNISGITTSGPPPGEEGLGRVTVDSCKFEANEMGINAFNRVLMNVRNSTIAGSTTTGLWVRSSTANFMGEVIVDNCQINHNTIGILANGTSGGVAAVSLSRSTITRNRQAGISLQGMGYAYSFGNNSIFGNNPDITGGNLQIQQLK
jgi:Right handed beta helix region